MKPKIKIALKVAVGVCAAGAFCAVGYYFGKKAGIDIGLMKGGEIEGKHIDALMDWHKQEVDKGFHKITDTAVNESINYYMMKNYHMVQPEKDFDAIMERVAKNKAVKQILQGA